jgi:hypothetical protein
MKESIKLRLLKDGNRPTNYPHAISDFKEVKKVM